jgi:hypothetical protein
VDGGLPSTLFLCRLLLWFDVVQPNNAIHIRRGKPELALSEREA